MSLIKLSRKDRILFDLIDRQGYISSGALSKKYGVSERTIRSEIKVIKEYLSKRELTLKNINNKGYLICKDKRIDIEKIEAIKKKLLSNKNDSIPNTSKDRVVYILRRFLLSNDYIKISDLVSELYVSKTTISADIRLVKEKLKEFDLNMKNKSHHGLKVIGKEENVRRCILKYSLDSSENSIYKKTFKLENNALKDIDINKIERIIKEEVKRVNFQIYDIFLNNLIIHIAITIRRIIDNCYVQCDINVENKNLDKDILLSNNIITRLSDEFNIDFPESEKKYILVHIAGKKITNIVESEDIFSDATYILTNRLLGLATQVYHYDFISDHILRKDLYVHLKAAQNRMKLKVKLRNPMIKEIKKSYPLAFEIAIYMCSDKDSGLNNLSEDEIGYIALHFAAAIERSKGRIISGKNKKVLITCASGIGTVRLLEVKLKNEFKDYIDIYTANANLDLKYIDSTRYDLILTTVPINFDKDNVLYVNAIPSKREIEKIRRILFKKEKPKSYDMRHIFNKDLFLVKERVTSKKVLIKEMCNKLVKEGYTGEDFYKKVIEREEVVGTIVGDLLAIPHPIRSCAKKSTISTCILKEPVKWKKDREVQVVFLLAIKYKEAKSFDKIYDLIVNIVEDIENINNLIECNDYDTFIKEIETIKYKEK
ncbi:BglG family transcription antiterminator [Clostridium oceanicum]|uniref:BglG family transcription antiterminator n=1 Tax=Clostridium oceanicum TaxID=1543 RepID=A0ABN1JCK8_9CLOT